MLTRLFLARVLYYSSRETKMGGGGGGQLIVRQFFEIPSPKREGKLYY